MSILIYWFRFKVFIESQNGISQFAERCVSVIVEKSRKKKYKLLRKNIRLIVKLAKLENELTEINKAAILSYDEFFGIRKRVLLETSLFWLISISEMFLNYISTLIFIPGEQFLIELMRWAISIVVTGISIITSEKFFEEIMPIRSYKTLRTESRIYISYVKVLGWFILLLFIEYAILSISEARARDIGEGTGGTLYFGFILLSMILPLVAGYMRRDTMQYLDPYKNTLEQRKTQALIKEIKEQIGINKQSPDDFFMYLLIKYWKVFNNFKTFKENYNIRYKINENISPHFCDNFENFQDVSKNRYLEPLIIEK